MLTIKGIKEFCYEVIKPLVASEDDIKVEKLRGCFYISFIKLPAPEHLVKKEWERRVAGTKYEKVRFK